ncbi:MAG TPA: FliH/SctL family protein [Bryobacteraceae bacterium]|nr:FliH/SctL family protein [Bryobacteraceae bacterium]
MSSKLHRGEQIPSEALPWLPTGSGVPSQGPSYSVSSGIPASGAPDSRIQAAYQEGLRDGQASGQQQMAAQLEAMEGRLARSIEELTGLRARFRHEAEEDVVELALAIARRVLHRELTVAPDALLGLVKAALEKIEAREVHRVRVSREDAPQVQRFFEEMGLPRRVEVIADPSLPRGAVILDSTRGLLDASVETQLLEIERGFADLVRRT